MGRYSLPYLGETGDANAYATPKAAVIEASAETVVPIPHLGAPAFVPRVLGYNEENGSAFLEAIANGGDRIGVWEVDARTLAILRPLVTHPDRGASTRVPSLPTVPHDVALPMRVQR